MKLNGYSISRGKISFVNLHANFDPHHEDAVEEDGSMFSFDLAFLGLFSYALPAGKDLTRRLTKDNRESG